MSLFLSFRPCWDTQDTSKHTVLTCVLCVLISASLDAQNTGEHISARPCPCFSLFDTTWTHRTRASTLVLARVLYVRNPVPSPPGHLGHERAHRAHSCPVCPYLGFFGCPEHGRAH